MRGGRTVLGALAAVGLATGLGACGGSSPSAGATQSVTLQAVPDGVVTLATGSQPALEAQLFGVEPGARYGLSLIACTCLDPGSPLLTFGQSDADGAGRIRGTFAADGALPSSLPSALSVLLTQRPGATAVGCTQLSADRPTAAQRMFPLPAARGSGKAILTQGSGQRLSGRPS